MKKLIDIGDLRVGMYVCGFDRAWIKTPFLSHYFLIDSQQQLIKILALDIDHIYIDTEKGLDVEEPEAPGDSATTDESLAQIKKYISIECSSLKPGTALLFGLYQDTDSGKQLYLKRGAEYTIAMRQALARDGVRLLYIDAGDEEAYVRYLEARNMERDKRATYTSDEFYQYNKNKAIHFPLERELLSPGTKVDFSLYSKRGFFYDPLLIVDHAIPVELAERHVRSDGELSIRSDDIPRYQDYITRHLKGDDYRSAVMVTRENSKMKVREILANYSDGKAVRRTAEGIVKEMVGVIMGRKGAFISLLNLHARDMYTYTHSVNVATLAISLGTEIGLSDNQLLELGLGCILHDIGKSLVSLEILNKPDRLTMREMDAMKKHVIYGHDIVRAYDDIPPGALIPILQHHETLVGSGYPYGIRGSELELFGKIASITDLYDAITTDRPYKKAFTPFYALSVISKERDKYDPVLYAEFVKMLGTNA